MIAALEGLDQRERICQSQCGNGALRLNYHLSNTIEVLAGDLESVVDLVKGPFMGEDGLEPIGMKTEEFECLSGFVVRAANVEDREFFAPHRGTIERNGGNRVDTSQGYAAGIASHLDCLIAGVLSGGAVDRAIDAASSGVVQQLLNRRVRFERSMCAEMNGQFAAVFKGFNGPDSAGVCSAECSDGHEANRACANYCYMLIGLD